MNRITASRLVFRYEPRTISPFCCQGIPNVGRASSISYPRRSAARSNGGARIPKSTPPLAFIHRLQNARRIGIRVLDKFNVPFRINVETAQREAQSRIWNGAKRRAHVASLTLQFFY